MIYTYPKPQTIYYVGNSVFLMCEDVSSTYQEYVIPYYDIDNKLQYRHITYTALVNGIRNGFITKKSIKNKFNNKPFYEIPLEIQQSLF